MNNLFSHESPLTAVNIHRIDIILPRQTFTFPLIDSAKCGDIVNLIKSKGIQHFVICRNSKSGDFYDVLYCDDNDQQIHNLILQQLNQQLQQQIHSTNSANPTNFLIKPLKEIFVANTMVNTLQQRMALFVFSLFNFKEMLFFRSFTSPNQNVPNQNISNQNISNQNPKSVIYFRNPEKTTFKVKLSTGLIINVKCLLTITVNELAKLSYDKMVAIYNDSGIKIKAFRFFKLSTRFGAPTDCKNALKAEKVVLDSLQYQKRNPNSTSFFLIQCFIVSNFDKKALEFIRELDLCKIPVSDEIRCFNSSISLIRTEIEQKKIEKWQSDPLLSRMRISDSEPPLPNIDINEYMIVVKAELRASKLNVEANIMTIRATLNTTADEVIQQLMNRLKSLRKNGRNSIDSCPFGNNMTMMNKSAAGKNSPMVPERPMSTNFSNLKTAASSGVITPPSFLANSKSPLSQTPSLISRPPSDDSQLQTHFQPQFQAQTQPQTQISRNRTNTIGNNVSKLPIPKSSFTQPQLSNLPQNTPLSQPPPSSSSSSSSATTTTTTTTESNPVSSLYGVSLRKVEKPPIPSNQNGTTASTPLSTPIKNPEVMSLRDKIAAFQNGITSNDNPNTNIDNNKFNNNTNTNSSENLTKNKNNVNKNKNHNGFPNTVEQIPISTFNSMPVSQPQSHPSKMPMNVLQQQQLSSMNSSRKSSFLTDSEDSELVSAEDFFRLGANVNKMRRKFSEAEALMQQEHHYSSLNAFTSNSSASALSDSESNSINSFNGLHSLRPPNYNADNDIDDNNISNMNFEQFVLVLSGFDEVLSGNRPLKEFVSVRQLVCAQQQVFSVHLVEKEEIISSINKNEMSKKDSFVEASREMLTWPIMLAKPPNPLINNINKENIGCIQHISIPSKLSVEVQAILNLKAKEEGHYFVKVCLIHGTNLLCNPSQTRTVNGKECVMFNETVEIGLPLNRIPREARIAFTLYKDNSRNPLSSAQMQQQQQQQIQQQQIQQQQIQQQRRQSINLSSSLQQKNMQILSENIYYATTTTKSIEAVATYNFTLFKFTAFMNNGDQMKRMWRNKDIDFFLACESNVEDEEPLYIMLSFSRFKFPVSFIPFDVPKEFSSTTQQISTQQISTQQISTQQISTQQMSTQQMSTPKMINKMIPGFNQQMVQKLMKQDPLTLLSVDEMLFLWNYRAFCVSYPELLPLVLSSIDYTDPQQVKEIPLILYKWNRPSPLLALTLLDAKFANFHIRKYAVECIEGFTDSEMMLYLLQLVQALKYELSEDSPLARFLIRRGLSEPKLIGHQLFWQLMSEAHLSHIRTRFSLILVNFMYGIGAYRDELIKGFKFTQDLVKLNKEVQNIPYNSVQETFRERLQKIEIPNEFHLPMDPRLIVESFIIEKCKVMNSKKKPFWLVFKNATPFSTEPVLTMFKVGDDLRQDQLILQIMKVMEHLWRSNGKDYKMRCYGVLPTGLNQGFIEVVPNSVTESDLQVEQGTFNKQIYNKFLLANNVGESDFLQAKETFLMSSVGYAVSTCVLGVADRHPGNIMIQPDGHFFHIDYGHFLGNFKTKAGVQCEDAPFHFIGAYMKLFGGKKSLDFKKFLAESGNALNVLRHNARLLITLLVLMLGTGIPELQKVEDIFYLKNKLFLEMNEEEATEKFEALTLQSLKSWKTLLKAKVHNSIVK